VSALHYDYHKPTFDSSVDNGEHTRRNESVFPPCPSEFVVRMHPSNERTCPSVDVPSIERKDHVNLGNDVFVRTKDDGKKALSIDYQAFLHLMDRAFLKDAQGN
jgi:hypothetical protein